ncbi:MAG: STAS/SEC14 domain-containing protein [Verrucomicrobiota bacterium]
MYEILSPSEGDTIGIRITGQLDEASHQVLFQKLDEMIAAHDKINLVVELIGFKGWGLKASIEDFNWCVRHGKHIRRIALIGDSKFLEWCIALDKQFAKLMGVEEKYFSEEQRDEAWAWAKA